MAIAKDAAGPLSRLERHLERHLVSQVGWLRPAVLGADDGIVSTASLILGVANAPSARPGDILIAGFAGLAAGALSMAAGEYVSVSSQADTETADLAKERRELEVDPAGEFEELTAIYQARGLDRATAAEVARQLMAKDALGAHARDELGISSFTTARPVQAALTSAGTFSVGAAAPLLIAAIAPQAQLSLLVSVGSLVFLAVLGGVGARAGGASVWRAALRVTAWGALAMAVTAGIGRLVGTVV